MCSLVALASISAALKTIDAPTVSLQVNIKDVSNQMTFDQRTFLVHAKADISLALSVCLEIEKGIHAFMEVERELISSMIIP